MAFVIVEYLLFQLANKQTKKKLSLKELSKDGKDYLLQKR